MEPIGKSPVAVPVLLTGKAAMACCWFFFLFKFSFPNAMLFDHPAVNILGAAMYAAGCVLAVVSMFALGKSLAVGLPASATVLKTHGVYSVSRNPLYVGAFAMCAGSCLMAMHPVNFLLFLITIAVHHRIIKKEEVFLEERFGESWRIYRTRVPRYLGLLGKQVQ